VDDLQELSRVEAGAFQLDLKPVSMASVVDFASKRLSRPFKSKGVTLTSDVAANLPFVMADEDRLSQVLLNLVGNALQYTPQGGKVSILAKANYHEMQVSVSDTGIGIPEKSLPHIFDRFYRVDKSRSRQAGGGSGIGLTIALRLVEAHGGHLWAESGGENHGSTFTFTLPLTSL
jgi:histidine kinase